MDTVQTPDGLALHLRHWPHQNARAEVLIVHGLGEHIGRYEAVAGALNHAGYAVSGYDQRGHGRSPGARGAIPAADSLCAALACVIDTLQRAHGRPPILLVLPLAVMLAGFVASAMVGTKMTNVRGALIRVIGVTGAAFFALVPWSMNLLNGDGSTIGFATRPALSLVKIMSFQTGPNGAGPTASMRRMRGGDRVKSTTYASLLSTLLTRCGPKRYMRRPTGSTAARASREFGIPPAE